LKLIYVAYPFTDDPAARTREVCEHVRKLIKVRKDIVPFIPHICFDQLLVEDGQYAKGYAPDNVFVLEWELLILDRCDGITFPPYPSDAKSAGIWWELATARHAGLKVYSFKKLLTGLSLRKCEEKN